MSPVYRTRVQKVSPTYRTRSVAYLPDQHSSDQDFCGAEDGIRTRDPHLGKVRVFVPLDIARPLKCGSVHAVSSTATPSIAEVEASTIAQVPKDCVSRLSAVPSTPAWESVGGSTSPHRCVATVAAPESFSIL